MLTILRLLASLKSAILLITVLTLLSVVGTLIPQNAEAVEYIQRFPAIGHMLLALGFDDIFRSTVFQAGLWLLAISTAVCIYVRWKSVYRRLIGRLVHVSEKELAALPCAKNLDFSLSEDCLRLFPHCKEGEAGNSIYFKSSGKISLWGGLILHIGFLAILAGGLVGMFYGVETAIRGKKGESVVIAPLQAVRAARDADRISRTARNIRSLAPQDPRLDGMRQEVERLHEIYAKGMASPAFKIFFENLWVENYENAAGEVKGIKSWNSLVRFVEGDTRSEPIRVKVNQPVSFRDFTFYQASWNNVYHRIKVQVSLIEGTEAGLANFMAIPASFPLELELTLGEPVKPTWSTVEFTMHDFLPDFRVMDGRFVSVSHQLNNPAARIVAYDTEGQVRGRAWAFPNDRIMQPGHVSNMPFLFTFVAAEPEFESGMQMAYDPGKPVVWLGCLMFTIGMILIFYVPYREEWLIVYADGKARLVLSGNRPPQVLNPELERVERELLKISQKAASHE